MRYPTLFLTLAAVCGGVHASFAQTPDLAVRYYESGEQRLKLEDWNGAAEDFTKAIEADARLHAPKLQRKGVITGDAFDSSHALSNEIRVQE